MTSGASETRIVVDARLRSGHPGGVEQVVIGMAHGLSKLDGPERYFFLAYEGNTDWLRPFVGGACSIVEIPAPHEPTVTLRARIGGYLPWLVALRSRLIGAAQRKPEPLPLPASEGTPERLEAEVIHFLTQSGFRTGIPSIYHPHDLQHRHLPEFFTPEDRAQRDLWWRALCEQAAVVAVTTQWGKADLVKQYGIDSAKIAVVHLAPTLAAYEAPTPRQCDAVRAKYGLESAFALYPAQTWPHKNHLRLVEAIGLLRDEGVDVSLVCTGTLNDHYPEIESAMAEAGLSDRVQFLGFVDAAELRALYQSARCLVMPTLFEAAGGFGPIAEAFLSGLPVACSNVTSLPEEVGDAAIVFDPYDPQEIADAVHRLWGDADLRAALSSRGRVRVESYGWAKSAEVFRAHYRRLAGKQLSQEDQALLCDPTDY